MNKIKQDLSIFITSKYGGSKNKNVSIETTQISLAELIAGVVGEKVLIETLNSLNGIEALKLAQLKVNTTIENVVNKMTEVVRDIEDFANRMLEDIEATLYQEGYDDGQIQGREETQQEYEDKISELQEELDRALEG